MDLPEVNTHSFIVKVWVEEIGDKAGRVRWRGYITHIPDGARRYVKRPAEISDFVLLYLEAMGVRTGRWTLLRRWLRRKRLKRTPYTRRGRRDDSPHEGERS